MQMLQCTEKLGSVESTSQLVELALSLEMMEQLSTVDEGQHQVQLLWRLERELEGHNERVIDLGQHGTFR